MDPECSSCSTRKREERAGGQAVGAWKATGPVTAATTRGPHGSPASSPRDHRQQLRRGAETGIHCAVDVVPAEQYACPAGVAGHGAGGPERVRKPEEPLLAGDAAGSSARKVSQAAIQSAHGLVFVVTGRGQAWRHWPLWVCHFSWQGSE